MRKIVLLFLLSLVVLYTNGQSSISKMQIAIANSYHTTSTLSTLSKELISVYECNEASGTIIDEMGVNNSSSQTVTYGNAGKNGNCLTFTGTDIVTLSTTTGWTPSSTSSRTISMWVNVTAAKAGYYGTLIGNADVLQFYLRDNTDPAYKLGWYNGTAEFTSTNAETFTHNTWYQLVMVKSGTSISLYKNNTLIGTGTESAYSALSPASIYIGNDNVGETFTGKIDMIRLYNRALSAQGVDSLYNSENTGKTYPTWQ